MVRATVAENLISIDKFAGGGGASEGIYMATGEHPFAAVNHDPVATAVHAINHPSTRHFCEDVYEVDPLHVSQGRPCAYLWASPDCTYHSKARGGAPIRDVKRRDLAMELVDRWIPQIKPLCLTLENVEEFADWGPLDENGLIIKEARGELFKNFIYKLEKLGYRVEWRFLRACDYGAPTMRRRLYVIARCDDQPIVWPEPSHGAPASAEVISGRLEPWKSAADCIDFSIPCPSIFASSRQIKEQYGIIARRPLKEATMRRIFRGLKKYVLDNPEPYIVPFVATYYGRKGKSDFRGSAISQPLATQTTENRFSLIAPYLQHVQHGGAKNANRVGGMPIDEPCRTITAQPKGGGMALVAPVITSPAHSASTGRAEYIWGPEDPLRTITATASHALVAANIACYHGQSVAAGCNAPLGTLLTKEHHALVTSHLAKMRGGNIGQQLDLPLQTITAGGTHFAQVRAFLMKYYSEGGQDQHINRPLDTITTKGRFGVVMVHGQPYAIVDIGMRMLQPRELARATGFPESYIIEFGAEGWLDRIHITKTEQVRLIGNAVCPDVAAAIVRANWPQGNASGYAMAA